jgi:hypothetical protein
MPVSGILEQLLQHRIGVTKGGEKIVRCDIPILFWGEVSAEQILAELEKSHLFSPLIFGEEDDLYMEYHERIEKRIYVITIDSYDIADPCDTVDPYNGGIHWEVFHFDGREISHFRKPPQDVFHAGDSFILKLKKHPHTRGD